MEKMQMSKGPRKPSERLFLQPSLWLCGDTLRIVHINGRNQEYFCNKTQQWKTSFWNSPTGGYDNVIFVGWL